MYGVGTEGKLKMDGDVGYVKKDGYCGCGLGAMKVFGVA